MKTKINILISNILKPKGFVLIMLITTFLLLLIFSCQKVDIDKMDNNDSFWATEKLSVNSPINSDMNIDIAIIGGGYTGLSAAYHLANSNPNLKIAVFEAKTVGNGASGRNGGMVLPSLLDEYSDNETFQWTYDLSVNNMRFMDSLSEAYGVDCDLKLDGYCEAIYNEEDVKDYQDYVKEANEAGIPIEYWDKAKTKEKLGTNLYYGAMYDPNGGSVHPMKLVKLLKTASESKGVKIYENSPVLNYKEGETIRLEVGSKKKKIIVNAKNIVLATNAYTSKLKVFKNKIMPVHAQTAATQPLTQTQLEAIKWNSKLPFYDSRIMLYHLVLTPDNRIIIGGGNVNYYFNNGLEYKGNIARVGEMMLGELVKMYPELKGIKFEYVWDGLIGTTYDEVETVGVTGTNKNIFYGLAYNGHGVNQSVMFGDVISHLYNGTIHGWEESEYYGYKLSNIPPEPFKFIGSNMFFKYWRWKDKK